MIIVNTPRAVGLRKVYALILHLFTDKHNIRIAPFKFGISPLLGSNSHLLSQLRVLLINGQIGHKSKLLLSSFPPVRSNNPGMKKRPGLNNTLYLLFAARVKIFRSRRPRPTGNFEALFPQGLLQGREEIHDIRLAGGVPH